MQASELNTINTRLGAFAQAMGDTPPAAIIGPKGEPTPDLMAYRAKHGLSLDWIVLGEGPQYRARPTANATDLAYDATFLHGLLQGLDHLINDMPTENSSVSNATIALSQEVLTKADVLLRGIETLAEAKKGDVDPHAGWLLKWKDARRKWEAAAVGKDEQWDVCAVAEAERDAAAFAELIRQTPAKTIGGMQAKLEFWLADFDGNLDPKDPSLALIRSVSNELASLKGGAQ